MAEIYNYEFHQFANLFPLNTQSQDFFDLVSSLEQQGMLQPVILYENMILDGRTRYLAYRESPDKIELRTEVFEGDREAALALSVALNKDRRNIDIEQKNLVAWRYAQVLPNGTQLQRFKEASKLFRVGIPTLRSLDYLNKIDIPEKIILINAIDRGELPVTKAEKLVRSGSDPKGWAVAVKDGVVNSVISHAKRVDRERKLSNETVKATRELQELGKDPVYAVIYIDPPWKFEVRSEAGEERSADQHYPTMTLEEIRALQIPAASDCAMFMWATTPHLANAIEILEGWGFTYKSCYIWNKVIKGLGYWTRNQCEFLLLGVKGEVPSPMMDDELKMDQIIVTPKLRHSEKPKVFADGITKMFPTAPKLEMFARESNNQGDNWFYWGNEVNGKEEITNGNGKRKRKGAKKAPGAEAETIETESTESGTNATA